MAGTSPASIINLPTELVEAIAKHLGLRDLNALRLAHPRVLPAQTTDRMFELQRWSVSDNHNGASPTYMVIDGYITQVNERGGYLTSSPNTWNTSLKEISKHPLYRTWLTSVCICMRPTSRGSELLELTTDGLGLALSRFPKLTTLYADGSMEGGAKVTQVLYDFICAKDAPPLKQLVFKAFKLDPMALRDLLLKHRSTLQNVFLHLVRVKGGTWRQDIFPTMLRCNLQRLVIIQDQTLFRSKNKWHPELECNEIVFMTDQYGRKPILESLRMNTAKQCREGLKWLLSSNECSGFMQIANDWYNLRIVFNDKDLEQAYRRRYRAAQQQGHRLPGEYLHDWWYEERYDERVARGYRWEESERIATWEEGWNEARDACAQNEELAEEAEGEARMAKEDDVDDDEDQDGDKDTLDGDEQYEEAEFDIDEPATADH